MNYFQTLRDKVNSFRLNNESKRRKKFLQRTINPENVKHLLPKSNISKQWYGNSYGGFYVHPDLLNDKSIVYSFGIGKDMSFDLTILKNHRCSVFAFDPTPNSIQWVSRQKPDSNLRFFPIGISTYDGLTVFNIPSNKKRISGSVLSLSDQEFTQIQVEMKTLSTIMKELEHEEIDLLKLDIEGAEYEVIPQILNSKIHPKQFIIEFHDRMLQSDDKNSQKTVELMEHHGYKVFANSISYEEISFIRAKTV